MGVQLWDMIAAVGTMGGSIVGLMTLLHYRQNLSRTELKNQLAHLDECIDKCNKDINALRLFMASNFSKQEIQEHWEKRDREIDLMMSSLGRHDSQIAVITSEMSAANTALNRVINRLEREGS